MTYRSGFEIGTEKIGNFDRKLIPTEPERKKFAIGNSDLKSENTIKFSILTLTIMPNFTSHLRKKIKITKKKSQNPKHSLFLQKAFCESDQTLQQKSSNVFTKHKGVFSPGDLFGQHGLFLFRSRSGESMDGTEQIQKLTLRIARLTRRQKYLNIFNIIYLVYTFAA